MTGHTLQPDAFDPPYLRLVREQIEKSPLMAADSLNRDFVGTRGFSVVFHRSALPRVVERFPWSERYLDRALRADCNAFYLNPLQLKRGSHVAPHIDRSLRAYAKDVLPPLAVSVLYVVVPDGMRGGELVLRRGRKFLARIVPRAGSLVQFEGDLEHGIERVDSEGQRLSLVCEQYLLNEHELEQVPEFTIETRSRSY